EAQEETQEATKTQESAQKNTQEKGQGKDQEEAQEKPLEEEITWQVPMVIQDPAGHKELMVQMERAAADFTLNDLDMAFRRVEAGFFVMGSDAEFRPIHIARPFYIGQFPVTQGQWLRVLGENPSFFDKGDNYPVDSVAWDEVLTFIAQLNDPAWWKDKAAESRKLRQFIARLNRAEGLDEDNGYVLRLPTEAEWEYACRAVSGIDPECPTVELQRWFFGNKMSDLGQYAWFSQNAGGTTHPVGEKQPNPWGLYDMYGNVEEWTWDCWSGSGSGDVTAVAELSSPVWGCCRRGGGWFSPGQRVGSACRSTDFATSLCGFAGLRLIIAPRLPAAKDKCMEEVYDQADYLFDLGFHDLARRLLACLAEDKYSEALNRLAIIYLGGYGVKMSKSRALSYLKKAARLKNPMAKLNLALFYKDDMKRYRRALRGFRVLEKDEKSDYRGEAAIEMAKMYMQGLGVRRNTGKAQKILDKLLDDVSLLERLPQGAREEILHLLKAVDSSR
ncbi:MAG: SUMF1/EgtB/PvdO family nonheme iron enzyme, partial [Gracilibacteraceae bacterium]|nr:SUMF1/EgtB/PvdO family nonheme iron enzyme [Gracilibacteraceae bacterium]